MAQKTYRRWDRSQMRQHQVMMVSVILLVGTGLPLRYASHKASQTVIAHLGGATVAGMIHRLGACGLMVVSLWHIAYLLRRWLRGNHTSAMMPALQDVKDLVHYTQYLLHLREDEPRFGRYNFIEKFEYWAGIWGNAVMIATGFILWFPVAASHLVKGLGIELARVIHGYEALLAALSILLWHMYHAHLRADVFPMSRVWLTGTLNEQEMRHHHPLELEALEREEAAAAAAGRDDEPKGEPDVPTIPDSTVAGGPADGTA